MWVEDVVTEITEIKLGRGGEGRGLEGKGLLIGFVINLLGLLIFYAFREDKPVSGNRHFLICRTICLSGAAITMLTTTTTRLLWKEMESLGQTREILMTVLISPG